MAISKKLLGGKQMVVIHGNTKYTDCIVDGCESKHYSKHMCRQHYEKTYFPLRGKGKSPEHRLWSRIQQRCYNLNYAGYKNYGGRGIEVYSEWRLDMQKFLDYIGKRPSSEYSLDRINNDGNYEPGNVRWATAKQQANNRRQRKPASFYEK